MISKKLFFKQIPSSFINRKFIPLEPLILPLEIKKDFEFKKGKADWLIEQIEELDSLYTHQFVFPQNNSFNPHEISFHKPKLTTLFHCKPKDPDSSLDHLMIGLHENYVLSLMAMPKEGNSMKLCRALSGEELHDLKQAHNPQHPCSFHFAFKAGADPRARASLVVRCDNHQEVVRIESFLRGINQVVPLNQELVNLATCIIEHSKKSISFAQKKDDLIKKKKSILLAQNIIQATYSEKIKDGVAHQYNNNIKSIEEQSNWPKSFDFPKKRKLNLFSGYPNGIPDLQRQKDILTYYPLSINHFPDVIPEIHLTILSNDPDRFKKILSDNPMTIYDRDCYGNLPIELTYQLLNPDMGAEIYDIWEKLPKSQQWATQVFVETANNLSTLEFHYGPVTDEDMQQCVKDYFKETLPMIDKPLDIYKAVINNDQQTITALIQHETAPWHLLKKCCLAGKEQEARRVFSQILPEKHALFAAALRESYPEILSAINDYLPDISGLDSSILYGKEENTRCLREESFLKEWKELQHAIDKASSIPEINKKMDELLNQINSLQDPLFNDRNVLDELNNELWRLHEEKNIHLAEYRKIRKTISQSQWELKSDLDKSLTYLEWLKKKIRDATGHLDGEECLKISSEIINNELVLFNKIHSAIQFCDDEKLKQLISSEFNDATGRVPSLGYRFSYNIDTASIYKTLLDGQFMPDHFELYLSLYKNDLNSAINYIEQHLHQKEEIIGSIKTIKQAKDYFNTKFPQRLNAHKQVINGEMPPIQQYVEEKQHFDDYKENIQTIFKEQCALLNNMLCSLKQNQRDITFIKLIDRDIRIEHSLIDLVTRYVNYIVINHEEMELMQKDFDDNFSAYLNNEAEKTVLLEIWQNIVAIKLKGIDKIQQCTEEYRQHSLCPDKQVFDVYTLTLIFQQSSIVYHKMLNTQRSQFLSSSLINLIKQSIQGKSWQERAKFTALNLCCNVGGFFDKLLDSIIKSSLLSYEYQDPWGYTPLLLAVLNNHVDIVRLFFEKGLVSSWIMPLANDNFLYYTLLSHSQSRAMTDLLLQYFTDPNTTFAFQEGLEGSLPILLMFHHDQQQCVDTHNQSLLDYIASGQPYDHCYLDALLFYRDVHVQEGPYDETMPEAVQKAFRKHNERITRKLALNELKPKIVTSYSLFQESGIRSHFEIANKEAYYSVLKKVEQLTLEEKKNLALLFAAKFKHPNDAEAYERSINFFNNKVLKNKNYIFELFYQEKGGVSIGFFCFQVKFATHPDFGQSLLVHLSLAGCDTEFADKGLLGTSFKVILALKKCSEELSIPLTCYGRFGRPGIAYTMLPAEAISSPKYHRSTQYIRFVAGAFDNSIEEDGSSIPPVYSTAKLNNIRHRQLDEFNFLLDERLHAKNTASLPVIFEVDDKLARVWHKKLADSMGITEYQVQNLFEQIKPWIVDDSLMQNNTYMIKE